ncbi:hypothetical protein C8R43DRAFT_1138456 [Mycena crocata]|nr:hypothetical protein C8R43DRAFT_1138456 [Mycena crocata]
MPPSSLPAEALTPVAEQAIYCDISDERDYSPPLDDKTWYLLSPGILSRNRDKLFAEIKHRFKDPGLGYDVSDYPCYAAPTFQMIVAFLPRCPDLQPQFKRTPSGRMKQTGSIYFVILGINTILFHPVSALRLAEFCNAPHAVILAVATYDEAMKATASYPPLSAAAAKHLDGIKKQVREALRETMGEPVLQSCLDTEPPFPRPPGIYGYSPLMSTVTNNALFTHYCPQQPAARSAAGFRNSLNLPTPASSCFTTMSSQSSAGFTYPSNADFPRNLNLSNPSYLQKIEDPTWYMTSAPASTSVTAHISRDRIRITGIWAEELENPEPGCDRGDYPTFVALTFKDIVRFLPRCPGLEGQYQRDAAGRFKLVGRLYFVVDGCAFVFERAEAYIMHQYLPDPFGCIFVTSNKKLAERRGEEFKDEYQ